LVYRLVINPDQQNKQQIRLLSEQEHYLRTVLRLKNGDRFMAMDGKENCWLVKLTPTGGEILDLVTHNNELPVVVTLMVALPKGNGFEEIVRYGTELGVNQFIPLISERTLLKPSVHKVQRWRKIATEAAEQSERLIVPEICAPISFKEHLSQTSAYKGNKYIAVARQTVPTLGSILKPINSKEIIIATGPEGGWTTPEVEMAIAYGFKPVSLGKRILRAITAPIMALSVIVATIEK
jgi:16S rRNA (uracil1498-N3)-methyltransferase